MTSKMLEFLEKSELTFMDFSGSSNYMLYTLMLAYHNQSWSLWWKLEIYVEVAAVYLHIKKQRPYNSQSLSRILSLVKMPDKSDDAMMLNLAPKYFLMGIKSGTTYQFMIGVYGA